MANEPTDPATGSSNGIRWRKVAVLCLAIAIFVLGYKLLGGSQTLQRLGEHESALRAYHAEHPVTVILLAFLLYVIVAGFAIPGALFLSISYAWYFRFWIALPLVSFASTAGATIAFLLSRYLFRDYVQTKFASRFESVNNSMEKDGPFYLFTLRLIPAIPFFIVNILIGLTRIRTTKYWWISQLGMLPGTIVFLLAGDSLAASVPTLEGLADRDFTDVLTPRIWATFILLAVFPVIARTILRRVQSSQTRVVNSPQEN